MARAQADLFDRLATGPELYRYAPDSLVRLNGLIRDKGRVLDVGCGDGAIGAALDGEVIGFDISPMCARRSVARGVRAIVADGCGPLPFRDETFDTVYCVDVLHHLNRQWEVIVTELARVLRPGGWLAIVEPDARNPFVRWTQAPRSPIRVAPWPDEAAIDPQELVAPLERLGLDVTCSPIHIEGVQCVRSVFPMWQRLVKAPFVIALAWWYREMPNKFAIVAQKPAAEVPDKGYHVE